MASERWAQLPEVALSRFLVSWAGAWLIKGLLLGLVRAA